MIAFQTLIRRTAAALGAIAALTATGLATAQTVTLTGASGSSCPYSEMKVRPNGNVEVTCTTVSSPGTFTLSAVTSLSTNTANSGSQIKVTRSNGTTGGVTVNFTAAGACALVTTSPLTFIDGTTGTPQNIEISTDTTIGNCIVTLTSVSAGTISGSPKTVKVDDPNADVAFAFAAPNPGVAFVRGDPVTITVTRTGGINGAWSIPYALAGTLANATGDGVITGGGTLSGTLSFAGGTSGNQSDTLTFTPPLASPPGLPLNLIVSLGVPTGGMTGQAATTGTPYTLNMSGPAVGCPVPQTTASDLGGGGKTTLTRLSSGVIHTFAMPTPTLGRVTGIFKLSETTVTFPLAPWSYEIHINKCKGLVQAATGDGCYASSASKPLFNKVWFAQFVGSTFSTAAKINAAGYCYAPPTEGPWYINIRYNYAGCTTSPCGWHAQWTNWAY